MPSPRTVTDALSPALDDTLRQVEERVAQSEQPTPRSRACRARRRLSGPAALADLERARRTVPRGSDAEDGDRAPAVALEVWTLHVRYERTGADADLAALVAEYEAYALSLARRLRRDREPSDDLDQVAREALVVALQRFECERGLPFPAFATPTILGALRRHYRDHGWTIRVPRRVHELAVPLREATDRLATEKGRTPTTGEVAEELGVEVAEVESTRQAAAARTPSSLDMPTTADGPTPHEVIGAPDRSLVEAEDHVVLREAIEHLGERDRELLRLYYFEELTQSQIADRYGVSQMQVSRWLSGIVRRLRSHMG